VTGVENVHVRISDVVAVALRFSEIKREVVLAPDHEQSWLLLAHPGLPFRITIQIDSVVVEEIALDFSLTGLTEKVKLVGPQIWTVALDVRVIAYVPRACSRERQEVLSQRALICCSIGPERAPSPSL
jgi:hypothetical protein